MTEAAAQAGAHVVTEKPMAASLEEAIRMVRACETADRKLMAGAQALQAGRLGTIEIHGTEVILGRPLLFNKTNIDQFDF